MMEFDHLQKSKRMNDIQALLMHRNTVNNSLLTERAQAIKLATAICPNYDPTNQFWQDVMNLSSQIKELKKEIADLTKQGDDEMNKIYNVSPSTDTFESKNISPEFQTPPKSANNSTISSE